MTRLLRLSPFVPTILLSIALAACGGDGGSGQPILTPEPAMATAGFKRFNENRERMGLTPVSRRSEIDNAAQGHSRYQARNDTITHEQIKGKPDFTGVYLLDRLTQANYQFEPNKNYASGEVISMTSYTDGVAAAEALITAIYHRFVIFEPMYKQAGVGATSTTNGYTYFTTDFAANNGLGDGLGVGKFTVYPVDGQKNLPNNFFSNSERPDPVPDQNEVGYPISVHANITSTIEVTTFTVSQSGIGQTLPVHPLNYKTDPGTIDEQRTPTSAAAIIPLTPLLSATSYTAQFVGSVDGQSVSRTWSFTTK